MADVLQIQFGNSTWGQSEWFNIDNAESACLSVPHYEGFTMFYDGSGAPTNHICKAIIPPELIPPYTVDSVGYGHIFRYIDEDLINSNPNINLKTNKTANSIFNSFKDANSAAALANSASLSGIHGVSVLLSEPVLNPDNITKLVSNAIKSWSVTQTFADSFTSSFIVYKFRDSCGRPTFIPDQAGYGFTRKAETNYIALNGGVGRYRKDFVNAHIDVAAQWTLQRHEVEYFYFIFNNADASPVDVDLILDSATLTRYTAYLVPKTLRLQSVEGTKFVVNCQLKVLPKPVAVDWPAPLYE